jgi:DNA-binding transcriptional LysR family regulator
MQWSERIGRRLKLRDLHILLTVAKAGSMGRAAIELAVSQPVVSKAIADLERVLGARLLDRGAHGVEPTLYGRALLKWSIAVFDDLRQGVKELEFLTDPTAGELRIGTTEPMAAGFVSSAIDQLSRRYPRVVFQVIPGERSALVERELRQRNVELVVTHTSGVDQSDINVEFLFNDRHITIAGTRSKWAHRRKIALADLVNEPWVLPPSDSIPGREIAAVFRASGVEPPLAHVVSFSIPLHQHLLATDRFVTMLPLSMLRLGKRLPLKMLPVDLAEHLRPTGIITLKNRTLGPVAQFFIQRARLVAKQLANNMPGSRGHTMTAQNGAVRHSKRGH